MALHLKHLMWTAKTEDINAKCDRGLFDREQICPIFSRA